MDIMGVDFYEACDKAIKAMNREIIRMFGQLKSMDLSKLSAAKTVATVYRNCAKRAKKRYYGIGFEAYVLGLLICGVAAQKAHKMAEEAIMTEWVEKKLEQTDFVTLYRFESEMERKIQRLVEALGATDNPGREIDKAARFWSQQLGQYAINMADYAVIQAYQDAGVEMVEWMTAKDERVCNECHALDGQVFRADEVPAKPHWGCRCLLKAVFR